MQKPGNYPKERKKSLIVPCQLQRAFNARPLVKLHIFIVELNILHQSIVLKTTSRNEYELAISHSYFIFMYMHNNHCHRVQANLQVNIIIIIIIIILIIIRKVLM